MHSLVREQFISWPTGSALLSATHYLAILLPRPSSDSSLSLSRLLGPNSLCRCLADRDARLESRELARRQAMHKSNQAAELVSIASGRALGLLNVQLANVYSCDLLE